MTDNKTNTDGTFQPSAPVGTYQPNINPPVGTFQPNINPPVGTYQPNLNPPVGTFQPNMNPPVGTYQAPPTVVTYQVNPNPPAGSYQYQVNPNPPVGTYPSNPPVGTYPSNPPVGTYPSNPPAGTFQAVNPPVVTYPAAPVANTEAQSSFENFNRETARKLSITLVILGVVTTFLTSWGINFLGVLPCMFSVCTGVAGILSSKDPSKIKIVAFNILSSVTVVLNVIAIFYDIPFIIAGKVGFLVVALLLHGVIACVSGYSAYSSCTQFGWFGSGYGERDQQSQGGVIHRSNIEAGPHMNNSGPPGQNMQHEGAPPKLHGQNVQYEEAPPKPPSYDEAVKIVD